MKSTIFMPLTIHSLEMELSQRDTQHSQTFRAFTELDPNAHRAMLRFFERNREEIDALDFEEYFVLLAAYTNALFETGDHRRHLVYAKELVEQSIVHNIQYLHDEDIYQKALFQKAASHHQLGHFAHTEYILMELLKIDPDNSLVRQFLAKSYREARPNYVAMARALCVLCCLVAALFSVADILLVGPFFPKDAQAFKFVWQATLAIGLGALIIGEASLWLGAAYKVRRFAAAAKKRRHSNAQHGAKQPPTK
jgi:hypothetical protein